MMILLEFFGILSIGLLIWATWLLIVRIPREKKRKKKNLNDLAEQMLKDPFLPADVKIDLHKALKEAADKWM